MGIFSISSSVDTFNSSISTPAYDCAIEPAPEKITKESITVEAVEKSVAQVQEHADSAFKSDENPNKQSVLSQGCIQESLEILEKCFPPLADRLRKAEVKMSDLKTMPHEGFRIRGHSKDSNQARSWEFHHENRAKQDTGVTVFDGYHMGKGKVSASEMMFFPRKQVPQYLKKDGVLEVTLANGEKLQFNSSTGAIQSGVLRENKPLKGKPGEFNYDGGGVMIQMTGIDGAGKSFKETAKDAIITKKGFPPCKVPATKLWPHKNQDRANNFRFATDEALDQWLKSSKCGFSF